jgi:PhoH-like ATPase
MIKHFVLDTNILIDNPNAIMLLRNGKDEGDINRIFIPETVIQELDKLKRKDSIKHIISKIVDNLHEQLEYYTVIPRIDLEYIENPDDRILQEILWLEESFEVDNLIFVTNDRLLALKAKLEDIDTQEFKESLPFKTEAEVYTGIIKSEEEKVFNSFFWDSGRLHRVIPGGAVEIRRDNKIWNTTPRHYTQNAAMELLLDPDINILSLSSSAGYGKTHIAVAGALHSVLQKKLFKKIYVFKTVEDIGPSIGFLPGSLQEKIDPYMKYIKTMFQKLHEGRKGNNDLFLEDGELNPKYVEVLPLTYIRGMNIDDAYVIIDEAQNISRLQMRSLLTRMGDNVKVILCGDPNQVDNPNLNSQNNGLNWCVRLFKGEKNYGHITLGGSKSRGPICDLVHKKGL